MVTPQMFVALVLVAVGWVVGAVTLTVGGAYLIRALYRWWRRRA